MSSNPTLLAEISTHRRRTTILAVAICLLLSVSAGIMAAATGSFSIELQTILKLLSGWINNDQVDARDSLVFWNIRIPRILLGFLVGGSLALSGALMQGLFRNPLADPGIVGVSSGAALFAGATIVLADRILPAYLANHFATLPVGAFFGGLATTWILYQIATRGGRTSVATMLLAGIALGALAGAFMGLLTYMSDDRQLRDLTFWSLGSLGGATWTKVSVIAIVVVPLFMLSPFLARGLNAMMFGETEAFYQGYSVQKLKIACIVLVAAAVGVSVAAAGIIGFVGIVVPHVIRLSVSADHRILFPLCGLVGGTLLVIADTIARTIVSPAELPIGILTSAVGAPFFLWLLLRGKRSLSL